MAVMPMPDVVGPVPGVPVVRMGGVMMPMGLMKDPPMSAVRGVPANRIPAMIVTPVVAVAVLGECAGRRHEGDQQQGQKVKGAVHDQLLLRLVRGQNRLADLYSL